jgi:hypothetical protein
MTFFRTLAYLSPLLAGFGVAAALALTDSVPIRRRALVAGSVLGLLLFLLFAASFMESARLWGPLAILLVALTILVAGIYFFSRALGASREGAQILASLAVVLLMGSLFAFGPLIRAAADAGASGETLHRCITLVLDVNPFFVIGYSIFDSDLLVLPAFYRMGLTGFQHGVPNWPATAAGYGIVGLALAAASFGVNRLRKRRVE